jgi:hypothetical protein
MKYPQEPKTIPQWRNANKVSHKKGDSKGSKRQDSTWTERVEKGPQQHVLGVAKAPQDDQHTVYTTGAGSVVGSGSAALPKRLAIRFLDCSLKKSKKSKPKGPKEPKNSTGSCSASKTASQDVEDFFNGWWDVEWERVDLTKD